MKKHDIIKMKRA